MRSDLARRLAALEAAHGGMIALTSGNGDLYRIPAKRFYEVCRDAALGVQSADARAVLTAVFASDMRQMVELAQALQDGPMCDHWA